MPPVSALSSLPSRTRSVAHKSESIEATANLPVFWKNIRLLDLDQLPDCPEIGSNDEKKHMQSIEWALYRLFELYNPAEMEDKLGPFFPTLSPLQSRNLRSALFRCLSDLKKQGLLGPALLRKSMLDNCKGERFEETIAMFSGVVLKQQIKNAQRDVSSTTLNLVLASRLSQANQALITPLVLSHKSGLQLLLQERQELKKEFDDLDDLLELGKRKVARNEEIIESEREETQHEPRISESRAEAISSKVRSEWSADPRWIDAILDGEETEANFKIDLIDELDRGVHAQTGRLEGWKLLRTRLPMKKQTTRFLKSERAKVTPQRFDINLLQHINLRRESQKSTLGSIMGAAHEETRHQASIEYKNLIENMKNELDFTRKQSLEQTILIDEQANTNSPSSYAESSGTLERNNRKDVSSSPSTIVPEDDSHLENSKSLQSSNPREQYTTFSNNLPVRPRYARGASISDHDSITHSLLNDNAAHQPLAFSTPEKTTNPGGRNITPRDDLFVEGADYASVFKSRPKVKVSPHTSSVARNEVGRESPSLLESEQETSFAWQNSPLGRKQRL